MGMSRAAKMVMTGYRSRNEGNRAEGNRNEGYRSENNYGEMNRSEMYGEGYDNRYEGNRSENNRSEGNNMEMRRRRDSRGRFMQAEGYEGRGYQNEGMEGYRSEGRNEMRGYRNAAGNVSPEDQAIADGRMVNNEAYPRPYLLPRAIGFRGSEMDDQKGHAEHHGRELDMQTAKEWAQKLESEDGSKGARWTIEQVKPLMMQVKFSGNPLEFWIIMNSLYSDFCKMAEKYEVDTPEFFAEMAKAWLEDKDAKPHKAMLYYDCIVKQ